MLEFDMLVQTAFRTIAFLTDWANVIPFNFVRCPSLTLTLAEHCVVDIVAPTVTRIRSWLWTPVLRLRPHDPVNTRIKVPQVLEHVSLGGSLPVVSGYHRFLKVVWVHSIKSLNKRSSFYLLVLSFELLIDAFLCIFYYVDFLIQVDDLIWRPHY